MSAPKTVGRYSVGRTCVGIANRNKEFYRLEKLRRIEQLNRAKGETNITEHDVSGWIVSAGKIRW